MNNNVTDVEANNLPLGFALEQNYPNPFNPNTVISYKLASASFVELTVFDMLGCEVATLISKQQLAGKYMVNFNAEELPSGTYIYSLRAGEFVSAKKLVLMK